MNTRSSSPTTFLYESLWNLVGLLLIVFVVSRARTFDGENTCFYFIWYGLGRFWIEGLRTDSLYLFDLTLFGQPVRVSQILSLVLVLAAFIVLLIAKRRHPHGQEGLYVNRLAAAQTASAAQAASASQPASDALAETAASPEAPEELAASPEETPAQEAEHPAPEDSPEA